MTEARSYDHYQALKGWDHETFMSPTPGDVLFYDHYLSSLSIKGEKVVEIGFGNGNFLGWAQSRGALIFGTEIQQSAISKAKSCGVNVLPADISQSASPMAGDVTLMAALDVMEHLTLQQTESIFKASATMLKPGGLLLLRFPNGQSPLSLPTQYGDGTHITIMSIPIVAQMITGLPLVVDYAGPPFRTFTGGLIGRLARIMQSGLRRGADTLIRLAYGDMPMYLNAVMVLRRL